MVYKTTAWFVKAGMAEQMTYEGAEALLQPILSL